MGIKIFEKNKIDLDVGDQVVITITDAVATDNGQDFVDYVRNRDNVSGWATTGSTDAANTEKLIEFGESHEIDTIAFLGINWKAYTCQYWNGSTWTNFSTSISETTNTAEEKIHSFTSVETSKIKIVITGTMTPNDDKVCTQVIVTNEVHEFTAKPLIQDILIGKNRRTVRMLSGKSKVQRAVGSVSFRLKHPGVPTASDLAALERLYDYHEGFLVWLCGGDTSQFRSERIGYRKKDFYLMMPSTEYSPEWMQGNFNATVPMDIALVEVI